MKIRSVFSALSLSLAFSSMPALAADKVTFQLDWLPGGDKAPKYVCIQQGFFADKDLEVSIAGGRGSTDAITKLATGNSDIGLSDIGALLAAKAESAGKSLRVLPWSEAGLELYSASLVASELFLEERPDVAKRFVRAFAKAVAYTNEHPDSAGENINAMVPEVDAAVAAATIKDTMKLVFNDVSERDGMGRLEPTRLANTWKLVAAAQALDASAFDVETAVNRNSMPER